jgi:hypothetical protein
MIPPIIIEEHGDLAFFRSTAYAERYYYQDGTLF